MGIYDGARNVWVQWSTRRSSLTRDDLSFIAECSISVKIILIELLWLSLVGECLMALGDGQGPPLWVLVLVLSGPLGLFERVVGECLFCVSVVFGCVPVFWQS